MKEAKERIMTVTGYLTIEATYHNWGGVKSVKFGKLTKTPPQAAGLCIKVEVEVPESVLLPRVLNIKLGEGDVPKLEDFEVLAVVEGEAESVAEGDADAK